MNDGNKVSFKLKNNLVKNQIFLIINADYDQAS